MEQLTFNNSNNGGTKYFTLDELKKILGGDSIHFRKSRDSSKTFEGTDKMTYQRCYFTCNGTTGYVSKSLSEKLQRGDKLSDLSLQSAYIQGVSYEGFIIFDGTSEDDLGSI